MPNVLLEIHHEKKSAAELEKALQHKSQGQMLDFVYSLLKYAHCWHKLHSK